MKCPLCGSKAIGEVGYRKENNTHLWVCPECPFVGFEFYSIDNIEDVKTSLTI